MIQSYFVKIIQKVLIRRLPNNR